MFRRQAESCIIDLTIHANFSQENGEDILSEDESSETSANVDSESECDELENTEDEERDESEDSDDSTDDPDWVALENEALEDNDSWSDEHNKRNNIG